MDWAELAKINSHKFVAYYVTISKWSCRESFVFYSTYVQQCDNYVQG